MKRHPCTLLTWVFVAWTVTLDAGAGPQSTTVARPAVLPKTAPAASFDAAGARALLDKYCVTCHTSARTNPPGKLTLDQIDVSSVPGDAGTWERVIRKVRGGAMPPAGMPRPAVAQARAFASWVEAAIDHASAATPDPGRTVVHRLNRAEYANAVRDLVGLRIDAESLLPADDSGYGFDNMGDVLTMSPALLERYMTVARMVARTAVGDRSMRPRETVYKMSPFMWQDHFMGEGLPFGSRGGLAVQHYFPVDAEYLFKLELQKGTLGGNVRGTAMRNRIDVRVDGVRAKLVTFGGQGGEGTANPGWRADTTSVEIRLPIRAGTRAVSVSFDEAEWATEGVGPVRLPIASSSYAHFEDTGTANGRAMLGLEQLEISGPYSTALTQRPHDRAALFTCWPSRADDERLCAGRILERLARQAFRRQVRAADLDVLLGFYDTGRRDGTFESGVQLALEKLLVSPFFLFRVEQEPEGAGHQGSYQVSDVELASRLSFFLWSSLPDEPLLRMAESGRLRQPGVLDQQVRRMLRDPRAHALVDNFFGQWLMLRNLRTFRPDPPTLPEFDDNLRSSLARETELFLGHQLREDREVVELLTADYTFVNERLAQHYGLSGVAGTAFRRVSYGDGRRAGLLGQGSILAVTSYAHRTSPVLRGKFLLNLLGTPPPPPPPNVPPLDSGSAEEAPKSVRERMERHRRNPACAACHAQLDPLGFALENFNALGAWRTADAGSEIDPSGRFPDGTSFSGPAELRVALLERRGMFVQAVVEKLLTYALGRGLEPYDMPAVRLIVREAEPQKHRWSAVILGVVRSVPFQMRRTVS